MMREDNLVWIDLEMTGLNPEEHVILEIAVIITDKELNVLEQVGPFALSVSEKDLSNMNEFGKVHFSISGLIDRVKSSKVTARIAEEKVLEVVKKYCEQGKGILCGNSIHCDRMFLLKEMPDLMKYLHYRIIDVSTIKELVRRWYPSVVAPSKKELHDALEDIKESIEELKFYRKSVFREL